jgi:hypothetical protein
MEVRDEESMNANGTSFMEAADQRKDRRTAFPYDRITIMQIKVRPRITNLMTHRQSISAQTHWFCFFEQSRGV